MISSEILLADFHAFCVINLGRAFLDTGVGSYASEARIEWLYKWPTHIECKHIEMMLLSTIQKVGTGRAWFSWGRQGLG